jgi:hypothetical protein
MTWSVLLVPVAPALVLAMLVLTEWLERTLLSPRSIIVRAVKTRNTPEHAERLVAAEFERLVRQAAE